MNALRKKNWQFGCLLGDTAYSLSFVVIFSPLYFTCVRLCTRNSPSSRILIHYNFALFSHRHRRPIVIFLMPRGIGSIWRDILQFSLSRSLSPSLSLRFEFNSECQIHVHVHVRQNLQLTAIESGYNGSSSSSPHRWDKTTNIAENQINFHWHPFVVAHILTTHIHRVQRQTRKQKNLFVSNECELRTHSRARTLNELSYVRALISHFAPARSRYYYVLFRRKWNV